jgi:hypothetical protein
VASLGDDLELVPAHPCLRRGRDIARGQPPRGDGSRDLGQQCGLRHPATARTWLSRRCAAVRSAEFGTANAASITSALRCDASLPGRVGWSTMSPKPSSTAQPAGTAAWRHGGDPRGQHQGGQQRTDS